MRNTKMNIKQAFNTLSGVDFVSWALRNNYPYFIKIEGNSESGWIYPKNGNRQYKFNHKTN